MGNVCFQLSNIGKSAVPESCGPIVCREVAEDAEVEDGSVAPVSKDLGSLGTLTTTEGVALVAA